MKFRPASAVARELIRNATPKAQRPARRVSKGPRQIDLHGVTVLAVRDHGTVTTLYVSLTDSHRVLVQVGSRDAVKVLDRACADDIALPITDHDGEPALVLRCETPPPGLVAGSVLDVRVRFGSDMTFDQPVVEAVAADITVRRIVRAAAPITLPTISMGAVSDDEVGLREDPVAQERAERFLTAAIAYRNRRAA